MNTHLSRRTVSSLRTALTLVAFTVLAAIGLAAAQSANRATHLPAQAAHPAAGSIHAAPHAELLVAPAAAPMNAAMFRL